MSGQSFKQIVDALAGQETLPVTYNFSKAENQPRKLPRQDGTKKKLPDGVFLERKIHGAYTTPP